MIIFVNFKFWLSRNRLMIPPTRENRKSVITRGESVIKTALGIFGPLVFVRAVWSLQLLNFRCRWLSNFSYMKTRCMQLTVYGQQQNVSPMLSLLIIILCSQLTSLRQKILDRRFTKFTSCLLSYKNEWLQRLSKIIYLRLVSWEQRIMMKTQSGSLESYLSLLMFVLAGRIGWAWQNYDERFSMEAHMPQRAV